jgi:amino acid adenylation domain-containing protein
MVQDTYNGSETTLESSGLDQAPVNTLLDLQQAIEWNGEGPEIIEDCVHRLFESQSRRQPNASAVCSWDVDFTYVQLERAANRLAHRLIDEFHITPRALVHTCFDKSGWHIVAVLAINKVGAAWVPLDPLHPLQRKRQIVGQTKAIFALSSAANLALCDELGLRVVEVSQSADTELAQSDVECSRAPSVESFAHDAAYILFTSGSTGTPKGIVMEHGAVCTSQKAIGQKLGYRPGVRVLQFSSYVFDVSVGEIVAPLISGATTCVPSEDMCMSISDLKVFVSKSKVNWAFLTPSFAGTLTPSDFPTLELLVLMGEAVAHEVFDAWFGKVAQLFNGWGPTETCVFSTFHKWESAEESPSCIGRPVACRCWVVDPSSPYRLLPIGNLGELVVQGPTLLREYLNDRERTQAAIVMPLPDWVPRRGSQNWSRFYKTGDLVRYNADGSLLYCGRKDTQVKLRGQRVELGDIESQIKRHLHVAKHVVVELIRRESGETLVAFFDLECTPGKTHPSDEVDTLSSIIMPNDAISAALMKLTGSLRTILPSYMVPNFFVQIRRMPFHSSMKLDRKSLRQLAEQLTANQLADFGLVKSYPPALPHREDVDSTSSNEYRRLKVAWSQLLKINEVYLSGSSHFMSLGGDSIVAIRLSELMRSQDLHLSVVSIFKNPQLSQMASKVRQLENLGLSMPEPFSLVAKPESSLVQIVCSECNISKEQIQDIYPCTPFQTGLMTVFARQPQCYVIKYVYSLPELVDMAKYIAAWETAHGLLEILRTRIILSDDGEYLQVVVKEAISWLEHPLESGDRKDIETASHNMRLGTPLVSYGLTRGNKYKSQHVSITLHHALYDGWSLTNTVKLVEQIYLTDTIPPNIPSYSRFVRFVQDTSNHSCASFWRRELLDAPESYYPRLPKKDFQAADDKIISWTTQIPKQGVSGFTRATLCQVGWGLLLAKYEDATDVVFGCTLNGRNADLEGIKEIYGPTLATVPFRLSYEPTQSATSLLQATQKKYGEILANEQYGLANIGRLGADQRRGCSFRTALIIQTPDFETLEGDIAKLHSASATIYGMPLTITVRIGRSSDEITIRYDSRLLSEFEVERLILQYSHTMNILSDAAEECSVSDLDFCSSEDFAHYLSLNPRIPDRVDRCIHELFSISAYKYAEKKALQAWDGDMTYQELESLSNQLGRHLSQLGVTTETFVPICFDKSKWAIVAMLGILKAGGAYVPLDPGHPDARLDMILEDLNAKIAVTSSAHSNRLSFAENLATVSIDEDFFRVLSTHSGPFRGPANSRNASYAMFTSGSTGRPKGFVQEHGAYCTGALGRAETIRRNESSRVLQFASYGFDPSVEDIMTTLVFGGCVCIPSNVDRQNDIGLYIRQNAVNFANLTPSFAATIDPNDVPSLEILMTSGEPMSDDFVQCWAPSVTVMNGYGPTETCLKCALNTKVTIGEDPRNIGYPICANLWIIDPLNSERLVPVGAPGELMVESPCISRGYFRPGDSANGFIPPPKWLRALRKNTETHVFRTGDLVRHEPNGTIHFIGRKDFQVKINGQRTELGEIEAQLRKMLPKSYKVTIQMVPSPEQPSGVLTACLAKTAAMLTADPLAEPVLVTNLSKSKSTSTDLDDSNFKIPRIREQLSRVLPSYMIPKAFFSFDPLPLNISGKINAREILSLLSQENLEDSTIEENLISESLTSGESLLVQLWEKSIRSTLRNVSPSANFFDLGGDSLAAIRLTAFARRQGLLLPVAVIHDNPILKDMASLTSEIFSSSDESSRACHPFSLMTGLGQHKDYINECSTKCSVLPSDIEDIYPCTDYQVHFMVHAIRYPGQCVFQCVFPMRSNVNIDKLCVAIQAVVHSHDSLRARMVDVNGNWLQVVVKGNIRWERVCSLRDIYDVHALKPMMEGDDLNRFAIVENEEGHHFVWTTNHAISDGWSTSALVDQINEAYSTETSPLQEYNYNDFIHHTMKADAPTSRKFWTEHFDGNDSKPICPAVNEPLVDFQWHREFLPPSEFTIPVSLPTAILAAWGLVIGNQTGSNSAVLSLLQLGRDAPIPGIENMIGLLATAFPFGVKSENHMKIEDFLLSTQSRLNSVRPHQYARTHFVQGCSKDAARGVESLTRCVVHPAEFNITSDSESFVGKRTHRVAVKGECIEISLSFTYGGTEDHAIGMDLSFDSRALSPSKVQALMENFEVILVQLLSNPLDCRLEDLSWERYPALQANVITKTDLSRGEDWVPYPEK